jgi:hypothetical protein
MKAIISFLLLLLLKSAGRLLFRFRIEWVGGRPRDAWHDTRVIALLNHTSLYEPIYAAHVPVGVLWRIAWHGVLPIASKTIERPAPGAAFRMLSGRVVPLTRKRDDTWRTLLSYGADARTVMIICPEGRMLRPTGLDASGEPMTVRSGIADVLATVESGRMIMIYSGGLHHVAAPGSFLPRPFRTIKAVMESFDIAAYRQAMGEEEGEEAFRLRVVDDLTERRNRLCPLHEHSTRPVWERRHQLTGQPGR